ncbi:DUF4340 domain-containing protein [Candidatus Sumerlaeota bacterium]|nr:DUF4340 domain-containing protein [Candidatus Sumerlaeota bacterium]
MKQKQTWTALFVVAAILVGAAVYLHNQAYQPSAPAASGKQGNGLQRGDTLLKTLSGKMDQLHAVEYIRNDKSIRLEKTEDGVWVVASSDNYPANEAKLQKLFVGLAEIKVADRLTDKSERYAKFGVEGDAGKDGVISLLDASGGVVERVIRGDERKASEDVNQRISGRYMRHGDDPYVYLVEENLFWLNDDITQWVEMSICEIHSDDIVSVAVDHGSTESFTVEWGEDGIPELTGGAPEGMKVRSNAYMMARSVANGLSLKGVMSADNEVAKELNFTSGSLTIRQKDGMVYRIQTAKQDGECYMKIAAEDAEPTFTVEDRATTEGLQAAEQAAETAKSDAVAFNAKHGKWIYQIHEWLYSRLNKNRSELLEPEEETKDEPKPENIAPVVQDLAIPTVDAEEASTPTTPVLTN